MDRAGAGVQFTGSLVPAGSVRRPRVDLRGRIVDRVSSASAAGDGIPPRPHRPRVYADLTAVIDAAGGTNDTSRAEIAAATAAVLVRAGRDADDDADDALVALADRVGLDTLAELWREADPVSLPGALWALYVLRQWCRTNGDEVSRLWRAGEPVAAADAVVAGVDLLADVESVRRTADAVLGGVYRGDMAVALERAAALFRVVAAGRRELVATGASPDAGPAGVPVDQQLELAQRNDRVAADLSAAAARWRAGTLR
jgi:hypothetical protein